jgi:hypothetical protein
VQVPILSGIRADQVANFRTKYPRNLVPVPKAQGISQGYLRPGDGLKLFATGQGPDRGAKRWDGVCYRVSGQQLVAVLANGTVVPKGTISGTDVASLAYSFDRLAIVADGKLWYWDGVTLTQVTDTDLGLPIDVVFIDGYFVLTDGEFILVTDLNDPTSINPLKYGSSEADPDPIMRVLKVRNELTAVNRYTIEQFQNIASDNFPFQRIDGAFVSRGAIGRRAACVFEDAVAFLGGGQTEDGPEPPSVYVAANGASLCISTQEIDTILRGYTEAQLADVVVETVVDLQHRRLLIHLPDQTLVYDAAASAALKEPVWYTLDSGVVEPARYRARHMVWCYERWIAGDPTGPSISALTDTEGHHLGQVIGWDFGTLMLYNEGNAAIVHELELVALPGRVPLGADPVIWTSYSLDGETWSQEKAINAGKSGQRGKRLCWRQQGKLQHYRTQRFRGTSDAFLSFARLEAQLEPLNG